jgi:PAS domain S-box-containing protein
LKLAADEAKYRNIVESLKEGYFETDLEGRITFCNRALLQMSGYDRDELIGKTFRDVTAPRTARIMQATFGKVYKTGREANLSNYEVFHKSGHTLIVEFAAGLLVDARGEPIGFHGVLRDVSDQVREFEKQKQIQTQRIQVQKMDALGTLAGGLAHGFNNMLMAIQGNLSLIRMNLPADHPMQKHLERINQSTEKGGQLAREILSFAKSGKFVVMPTNLNSILKSTSRMFARANSKLKIHEFYQHNLWQTHVDRVQIGQVLLSLFMNAAEAMPNGGDLYLQSENVMLDESYTRPFDAKPGHHVKITVTDSGPGLDEEAKQRIFEPFFTAYRPLRYEELGLAAVYGTVKSHNGIINVYSDIGHGSTFSIYLPATVIKPPPVGDGDQTSGNETILLVDDDEVTARVGRDILERHGYRVMVVGNGNEAVDIFRSYHKQIRLVLLDIILPDLSGEQVYQELRRYDPNVRVVLASGYNVNKHIQALLKLGCVDFVQKPFQSKLLSQKIRDALDRDINLSTIEYPLTWSLLKNRNGANNDT